MKRVEAAAGPVPDVAEGKRDAFRILAAKIHGSFGTPEGTEWMAVARNFPNAWKDLPAVETVIDTALKLAESDPVADNGVLDRTLLSGIADGSFAGRLNTDQLADIFPMESERATPGEVIARLIGCVPAVCVSDFPDPGPDTDDPDCLFQNRWLRRGQCGALVAASGVGKSSLTIQAAIMWGIGRECLGIRPTRALRIGIFQTEDDEYDIAHFRNGIRRGLRDVHGWTDAEIATAEKNVLFFKTNGERGEALIARLRNARLAYGLDIIVLNPFFAFFDGEMNDNSEVSEFLRKQLDPFLKDPKTKCGCLIVHHISKPKPDSLAMGDVYTQYLGNGASEFVNYIRSGLVIMPRIVYAGRVAKTLHGVFRIIGAKHGDKLRWKDANGNPTLEKIVCYANHFPEYHEEGRPDPILWIEPGAEQDAWIEEEIEDIRSGAVSSQRAPRRSIAAALAEELTVEESAGRMAERIRDRWAKGKPPAGWIRSQREWVSKRLNEKDGCGNRVLRADAYNLLCDQPDAYGLQLYDPRSEDRLAKKGPYLIAATPDSTSGQSEPLNEQSLNEQ